MIELPDVTLISVDTTDNLEGTLNGIYTSMSGINFGAIKLITTKEQIEKNPDLKEEGITLEEPVREIKNYNDYNYYVIYCLHNHVETSHCLLVQPDGFVLFPDKWDDEWLKYDYIGAPWPLVKDSYIDPFGNQHQVGNGGFSLRSKKLLEVPQRLKFLGKQIIVISIGCHLELSTIMRMEIFVYIIGTYLLNKVVSLHQ